MGNDPEPGQLGRLNQKCTSRQLNLTLSHPRLNGAMKQDLRSGLKLAQIGWVSCCFPVWPVVKIGTPNEPEPSIEYSIKNVS